MEYSYETIADIIELAQNHNCSFGEVILRSEVENYGSTIEEIYKKIDERLEVFDESINAGLNNTGKTASGMSGGQGKQVLEQKPRLLGSLAYKAMAYALLVNEANTKMFKIVACPTAGSCGVLPGVMKAIREEYNVSQETVREAFLVAAGIGNVVSERACVAGAVGGCQAEVGTAAAMAAGAAACMLGGDAHTIANAFALSLKNVLGLVCDPVAGLVEVPCVKRNGVFAVQALTAAEMAMAGLVSQIPADEVVDAMNRIGRALPESLRETSTGGLAVTPTGKAIAQKLSNIKRG